MLRHIEAGTGPAIVLLHAFPVDSALWTDQLPALGEAGYRVIAPDLPGFGGSALSAEQPSLDVVADAVAELLDPLKIDRAIVVGLSMGGYVAMAMLRRHPGRIRALALIDSKVTADTVEAAANRERVAKSVEEAGNTAALTDAMLPNLLGATSRSSRPDVVSTLRRWIGVQHAAGVAWAQRAMAARPDSAADIEGFGGPVLVVVGEEDTVTPPSEAQAIVAAAQAGGSITGPVTIPGVGHLSAMEDPDAVNAVLLEWLATLP